MGFFDKILGNTPTSGHPLEMSRQAANVIKTAMKENGIFDSQDHCVVVDAKEDFSLILDIRESAGHVGSSAYAHKRIRSLEVVIPIDKIALFEGSVVDYDQAGNGLIFRGGIFETTALVPGNVSLSDEKMKSLCPSIRPTYSPTEQGPYELLAIDLRRGDTCAAMVVQTSPLVVAAYADELDAVALLRFPNWLVNEYDLRVGTKLLSVNTYEYGNKIVPDLEAGPLYKERYCNFVPLIADFLSDDTDAIEKHIATFTDTEWNRTKKFAEEALLKPNYVKRDGVPPNCGRPAGA